MNILSWIANCPRVVLCIALVIMFVLAGILVRDKLHQPTPITLESQQQASTSAGVKKAANAAQVPISPVQAAAIAAEIKDDADKPPDAVVQTTGARLKDTIETELQKSGGQFVIVTDPKNPASVPALPQTTGKAVSSANAGTIYPNTPVTLNQYNIKAYPDRLIQVGGSYQEVFAAYSWKVNVPKIPLVAPRGGTGYLGFYGHANLDRPDMSRVGIMLTIPK